MASRRLAGTFVAIVVLVATLVSVAPQASARIPVETFAAGSQVGRPKISPNGRYIATPIWKGGTSSVYIMDFDAPPGTKVSAIAAPADVDVDWVEWANDDRLLISLSGRSQVRFYGLRFEVPVARIVALDRNGGNRVVLFGESRRFRYNLNLSNILHPLPDDPQAVLMAAYDRAGRHSVYRVNVYDGEAEEVARGSSNTFGWLTDLQGVPRVRWDRRPRRDSIEVYLRRSDRDDWDEIAEYGEKELPDLNIVGFADDPRIAIVASRQTGDRYGLFEFDVATRALGKLIFQHPSVDVGDPVGGPIYDPRTTKLAGVYYVEDVWQRHYFEPDLAAVQQKLDATFLDAAIIRTHSWSRHRTRFIVFTEGPRNPGDYFVFDSRANQAVLIGHTRPDLPAHELGEMLIVKYRSRDGTRLPGYLTMPPGKGDKRLPMVVLPHGGPEHRDFVQYDKFAQMLANRGYVVFQPNFRGSGGYGKAFAEAGYRQWGRRMQDDVTDGVKALIADGTADPARICIVGASYGGYAALAGGAFTPELYKCVVAIAAVTDLPKFVATREKQLGRESKIYEYWIRLLGDPRVDEAQMIEVSPARRADRFAAPVLLVHGEADSNVPIEQSKLMDEALRAAGKPVEFVSVPDEGHNFSKRSSDIKLMSEVERFLTTHIGN